MEIEPIGVFDSGLGGLTVVRRLLEKLPGESIVYLADQAHIPYGERTPDEIRRFALGISDFLIRRRSRLIIMACNMSSATALDTAQAAFPDTPIIGVIEAGVRAAIRSNSGEPIGILATTGTVKALAYTRLLNIFLPSVPVYERACPKFVPLIEAGRCDCPESEVAVREYVQPLLDSGCRTLILGCTHYPFLLNTIRRVAGQEIEIVDPAEETAAEAANILFDIGKLNNKDSFPALAAYTTSSPDRFAELGSRFLGRKLCEVHGVNWGLELEGIEWPEKTVAQTTNFAP